VNELDSINRVDEFARRRLLCVHPQLARAVPHIALSLVRERPPLRVGPFPHCVENGFWRYHMEAARRREANDASAVIGPVVGIGSCLEPLRCEGDIFYFDPTLSAEPGDVVLFQAPASMRREEETTNPFNLLAKVLVVFADELFLAFRDGMYPLGDLQILGVEVKPILQPSAHELERIHQAVQR
jgi:hypothetical protein